MPTGHCWAVVATACAVAALAFPVSAQPLSCEMKSLLVGTSAMLRDSGRSRDEARKLLRSGGDLTAAEVDAVLAVAYNPGFRRKTPDQIKDAVYEVCLRINR